MPASLRDTKTTVVGRDEQIDLVVARVIDASTGRGAFVLIEGEAGVGKSTFVQAVIEHCRHDSRLEQAHFVLVDCVQDTSPLDAYQPFVDLLQRLLHGGLGEPALAQSMRAIIQEADPNLAPMTPAAAALVSLGLGIGDDRQATATTAIATRIARVVLQAAQAFGPLVFVIDDARWIDASSCQVLQRLAHAAGAARLVVIVASQLGEIDEGNPLGLVRADLVRHGATIVHLAGWDEAAIRERIEPRYGHRLHERLPGWPRDRCDGNPAFVTHSLAFMERVGLIGRADGSSSSPRGDRGAEVGTWALTGALEHEPLPATIVDLLDQRLQLLDDDDRTLLEAAAARGDRFRSTMLAELLDRAEVDVSRRLRRLSERDGIIRRVSDDRWALDRSDVYRFDSAVTRQLLYQRLGQDERRRLHATIAAKLEAIEEKLPASPRSLLLEIARHHEAGDNPAAAARHYLLAARSSLFVGAGPAAVALCRRALGATRRLTDDDETRNRLFAETTTLLLAATERDWGSGTEPGEEPMARARAAEAAALRSGDRALAAHAKFLVGRLLATVESRDDAVAKLEEALIEARAAADALTEVVVLSELGHLKVGDNVESGLVVMRQAHDLFTRRVQPFSGDLGIPSIDLDRYHFNLLHVLGVAEFDRGNFDEAARWLEEARDRIERSAFGVDLERVCNFLGQLYTAVGRFEVAEAALTTALASDPMEDAAGTAGPWRAYNRGQLGKLYLEWGRLEEAATTLQIAWRETQRAKTASLTPLVANFYAEALIHPDSPIRDETLADKLLRETASAAGAAGFYRSRVAAWSLLGRLALMQRRPLDAFAVSAEAVGELERRGTLPALRTEEVLYHHARICLAVGRAPEAASYVGQAHDVLLQKANTLADLERRRLFLARVTLSRDILAAAADPAALGQPIIDSAPG